MLRGAGVRGLWMLALAGALSAQGVYPPSSGSSASSAATLALIDINVKSATYGAVGDGSTDDSTAVTSAATACNNAGGGRIYFPAGTFIMSGASIYSNCSYVGAGIGVTIIKLKAGANADVFKSSVDGYSAGVTTNYAAANHTGSATGIHHWRIENLTIDGNNTNQTTGGYGIRQYGYNFKLINVEIRNTFNDCLNSDYNAVIPSVATGAIEAQVVNLKTYHCGIDSTNVTVQSAGSVGIRWGGPTDSHFSNIVTYQNASHGMMIGPNGGAAQISNLHSWGPRIGNSSVGLIIEGGTTLCSNCEAEGSDTAQIALLAGDIVFTGRVFQPTAEVQASIGIQVGQAASANTYAGVFYQATPGNLAPAAGAGTAASSNGDLITARINNCYNAGIAFNNEQKNDYYITAEQSAGGYTSGTPASTDNYDIRGSGLTCAGTLATCGGRLIGSGNSVAFTLKNASQTDLLNVNATASKVLQLVNGTVLQLYSDNYSTKTFALDNSNGLNFNAGATAFTVPHAAEWSMNGGLAIAGILTKTTTYTTTFADYTILCDATTAGFTTSIISTPQLGQLLNFKKIDSSANVCTLSGNGKNIDGTATITATTQNQAYTLQYNGTAWYIL